MKSKKNSAPKEKDKKEIIDLSPSKNQAQQTKHDIDWKYLLLALLLTLIAFSPIFNADFVTWDDPDYVNNNKLIQSFSHLNELIRTPVQGNHHPLTMISLALNYAISGTDPQSYHIVNLLLHLLNIILVFLFVYKLTQKQWWIAFITALLFGIHPLHVESVAWVAERKDVLYALFFLSGLIFYLKYLEDKKLMNLLIVLVLFTLSLLSKPAAVIFPLILIAIDYYHDRLKNMNIWVEKIPFLVLSLIMGLLTFHAQTLQGAVAQGGIFPLFNRFFFGSYGLMMYFIKTLIPIQLCTFYPFPAINQSLPIEYYLSPLFVIAMLFLFFKLFKKNKLISFSILFYIVNLLLVLQFIPVGSAIIADRYTYLPIIGIFMIAGYYIQKWADQYQGKLPMSGLFLIATVALTLTALANKQAATWHNTTTMWDQVLSVEPSSTAYTNRGLIYKLEGNREKAIELYSKAISLNKIEQDALTNRGNIYFDMGQDDLALADYRKSMSIKPKNALLLTNIGCLFGRKKMHDSSLYYFNTALKIDSGNKETYIGRALCNAEMGRDEDAISDYKKYLKFEQDDAVMSDIGVIYAKLGKHTESVKWFDEAIQKNPKSGRYYLNRSYSYLALGNKNKALQDATQAQQLGEIINDSYWILLK